MRAWRNADHAAACVRLWADYPDGRADHVRLVHSKLYSKSRGRGGCVHDRSVLRRHSQHRARPAADFHLRHGHGRRCRGNRDQSVRELSRACRCVSARQKHRSSAPEVYQPQPARLRADSCRRLPDDCPAGHGKPCLGAYEHTGRSLWRRCRRGAYDLQQDLSACAQRHDRHRAGLPARRGL